MTVAQYCELMPVYRNMINQECQFRGITVAEFTEEDFQRLKERIDRAAAMIGKKAEEIRIAEEVSEEETRRQALLQSFEKTVPARYRGADLYQDFTISPGGFIEAFMNGQSGVLAGGNGIGKTRLAWALARYWKQKDPMCSVEIVKGAALLSEIKATEGDWYRYIRDEYGKADHLFIDEIDKIKGSEADWMLLTYLIDFRYEWCRQTIVIGNCTRENAIQLIGQSSYSRLAGDGAEAYHLTGKDRRKEGGSITA